MDFPPREVLSHNLGRWGLAIIDLQERFIGEALAANDCAVKNVLSASRELLSWARTTNGAVEIYLIQSSGYGKIVEELYANWPTGVKRPHPITKHGDNAFSDCKLPDFIRRDKVRHLIVGGVNTDACVARTIYSAVSSGLRVVLPCDATAQEVTSKEMKQPTPQSLLGGIYYGKLRRYACPPSPIFSVVQSTAEAIWMANSVQPIAAPLSQGEVA